MAETHNAPLRTIIVDDEPLAVERLEILASAIADLTIVGTASDGQEGVRLAQECSADLVLLDIEMPHMDGISAARALQAMSLAPAVILVTAYDNFAVEAFDLDIADYVLKPVAPDRLERAVARALFYRQNRVEKTNAAQSDGYASEFWVSHRSELIRIAVLDIDHIEAERDYMRLHVSGRSYLLHQTISTLEQRLNPAQFQRIHRSHIIRRDRIAGLRHEGGGVWHALLTDDASLRIGRKYLTEVKKLAGK